MKDEKEESDPEQCDQGNQELEAYFVIVILFRVPK